MNKNIYRMYHFSRPVLISIVVKIHDLRFPSIRVLILIIFQPFRPGGIPARNHKGERLLLYLGIIDILQSYKIRKKLEHTIKAIIHDGVSTDIGTLWKVWRRPNGPCLFDTNLIFLFALIGYCFCPSTKLLCSSVFRLHGRQGFQEDSLT